MVTRENISRGLGEAIASLETARELAYDSRVRPLFDLFIQEARQLDSWKNYEASQKDLAPFDLALRTLREQAGITSESSDTATLSPQQFALPSNDEPEPQPQAEVVPLDEPEPDPIINVSATEPTVPVRNDTLLREVRQKIANQLHEHEYPMTPMQLWDALTGIPGSMVTREILWMINAKYIEDAGGRYWLTQAGKETYLPDLFPPGSGIVDPTAGPRIRWQQGEVKRTRSATKTEDRRKRLPGQLSIQATVLKIMREFGEPMTVNEVYALCSDTVKLKSVSGTLSNLRILGLVTNDRNTNTWTIVPNMSAKADPTGERATETIEQAKKKPGRPRATPLRECMLEVIREKGPIASTEMADEIKRKMTNGEIRLFHFKQHKVHAEIFTLKQKGTIQVDNHRRYYISEG